LESIFIASSTPHTLGCFLDLEAVQEQLGRQDQSASWRFDVLWGRGASLDGERPRAGRRAEGSKETAQAAAGGGALQRAGGWHRRPTPASIGGGF